MDNCLVRPVDIMLRRELIAAGWTDRDIARAVACGVLSKVRYGAYVASELVEGLDRLGWTRVRSRAVLRTVHESSVLSAQSALAELGVPLWGINVDEVHLVRTDGRAGRREAGVVHHRGRLADDEWAVIAGVPRVVPSRAAIEVVTSHSTEVATVLVSMMLSAGCVTPEAMREAAQRADRWPNSLNVRIVLARADGRLTTVAEARTWHFFHEQRIQRPEPQVAVYDERGDLLGIVDFAWVQAGVFLEFDGRVKYDQHRRPGETLGDYLMREKRREEQICVSTGWVCVRITWADLERPVTLARRISRLLDSRTKPAA